MKKVSGALSNDKIKATIFLVVYFMMLGVVTLLTSGK